ncbi:MAG: NFACT RNA binding domain-containing protein [Bacillota bacterium]|nr:NFACT RNA binding domain-containing protein [Bacillota bacterium]MDW7682597.1 NFACT RNA binding domain-containing protein [Bacillota bacterium]
MSYDGITMAAVCREMNQQLVGARVEKIYQPRGLEIAMHIRTRQDQFLLLCSADSQLPRVHLTETKPENPQVPPAFCMLLRKHLHGARILSVEQTGLERVLTITFRSFDEIGNETKKQLVCEIMGKHSNIILTTQAGNGTPYILGAVKTVTENMSRHRTVMANEPYIHPPGQEKLSLFSLDEEELAQKLLAVEDQAPERMLVAAVMGLGIHLAREIVWRAAGGDMAHPLDMVRALTVELRQLAETVNTGCFSPCILRRPGSKPLFSPILLKSQPREALTIYPTVNEGLDTCFREILHTRTEGSLRGQLSQVIKAALTRAEKKLRLQEAELKEMEGADVYRINGELLTASIHLIRPGMREVCVPNYYSETQDAIQISLDPALSPQANAQRYFKKYRKLKDGEKILTRRIRETREELTYLDSIAAAAEHADLESLREIRDEMEQAGLIRTKAEKKKSTDSVSIPLHFVSVNGIDIYVGRNNRQNDHLTLKFASPRDTWLHTKDIPGAHVIVRDPSPPEETLLEAAKLAARFSRAAASANVPVDYTLVKHVKKPKGAKPGMVIYGHQKTVFVTPDPI